MRRRILSPLVSAVRPVDALIIAFTTLLSCITLFEVDRISIAPLLITVNLAAGAGIVMLAAGAADGRYRWAVVIHDWYPVPAVFIVFKEVYVIIQSIGMPDWDAFLIAADRWIFGTDPTVWCTRFAVPWATEILQLAYAGYYFIMIAVALELYLRRQELRFSYTMFVVLYGFFLSYIGYLLIPAVGPRFTLHTFATLDTELPGLYFTEAIRGFLNAGESIPAGVADAMRFAQRDAFPSGHTQMTLISLYLAHRYRLSSRYFLYPAGILLIISTVYLRYHYVVDVAGGVLFFAVSVRTAPSLFRRWEGLRQPG